MYFVQKKINQGYISLGHLGIEDTNPDYYAVQVMNFILGGGSFTSRITTKVRSDEGLAYNTGSRFTYRWGFPGTLSGYVQTKSATVGYAISLILKEFERIRTGARLGRRAGHGGRILPRELPGQLQLPDDHHGQFRHAGHAGEADGLL